MGTIIKGGHIVTMDPSIGDLDGDVLIEDNVIAAVGSDLSDAGADVVDARGRLVLPGLVDTHRHVWQTAIRGIAAEWTLGQYLEGVLGRLAPCYTAEDVYLGDLLGAREALSGGVTTVLDYNQVMASAEHADAALSGLRDAGIRAVFAPSFNRLAPTMSDTEQGLVATELARIVQTCADDGGLMSVAVGLRSPETASIGITEREVCIAREHGVRMTTHVGLGARGAVSRSIAQMQGRGLLGADLTFIHANTSSDDELSMVASGGCGVSISPRIEMLMGHGYPATGRLLSAGVTPGLSIDVVSGVAGDMFAEMRTTIEAETCRQHMAAHADGSDMPRRTLTARDVLEFATIQGARVLGLDERIGSLSVGKDADVVVLDVDTPELYPVNDWPATATQCGPANVEHVFVRGVARKRNHQLVGVDTAADRRSAEASRDRILAASQRH